MIGAGEIYQRLLNTYGMPRWWSDDPLIVMVQSVLVQNANWNAVEKTCAAMDGQLTVGVLSSLPLEALESMIRPCGFQKAKARTIKALLAWYEHYGFDAERVKRLPTCELRKELLDIKGIGAETADVLLVYAFFKPSFIVDSYTRRFLERLGYEFASDQAIRSFFEVGTRADARIYGAYHWLLLDHGINACRKTPKCEGCCFADVCAQRNKKEA